MPRLADPLGSFAVLIGTDTYDHLQPLAPVANNLTKMRALVTDDDIWGLPSDRCLVVPNPATIDQFMNPVVRAIEHASDTVLLYYAGHGLLHPASGDLRLALPGSDMERIYSSMPFEYVRDVLRSRINLNKIILLDCCYSGGAYPMGAAPPHLEDERMQVDDGTYVMTASGETNRAMCYPDEQYSAFTGELIEVVDAGLPVDGEYLDLQILYHEVKARLVGKNRPKPQQHVRNSGASVTFARNRRSPKRLPALPGAGALDVFVAPAVPEQFVAVVRRAPRQVLAEIARLAPAEAGETLRMFGTHAVPQGVAALLEILVSEGRAHETEFVLRGAAMRSPTDLVTIATVLGELGLPEPGRLLFETTVGGLRRPHELAAIAIVLKSSPTTLYDIKAFLAKGLLGAAGPDEMVELIEELWTAGLDDEAREMVALTTVLLPPERVTALADRLRVSGHHRTAFSLYRRAIVPLAQRSAQEVAELIGITRTAHQADIADGLLAAVADRLSAAPDATEVLSYLEALGHSGLTDEIGRLCDLTADRLALPTAIDLSNQLRELGQEDAADAIMRHHGLRKPDSDVVTLVLALREAGRPMLSFEILKALGERRDPPLLPATVAALRRSGLSGDEQRLLTALTAHPTAQVRVVEALAEAYKVDDRYFPMAVMRFLAAKPDAVPDLVKVVGDLGAVRERAFLDAIMAIPPEADFAPFFASALRLDSSKVLQMAAEGLPETMLRLLEIIQRHQPAIGPWLVRSSASLPSATLTNLLQLLGREMPSSAELKAVLRSCARLSIEDLVALVQELDHRGEAKLIDHLIDSWHREEGYGVGVKLLALILRERGFTDLASSLSHKWKGVHRYDSHGIAKSICDRIAATWLSGGKVLAAPIRNDQVSKAVRLHVFAVSTVQLLIEFRWLSVLHRGFLALTSTGVVYHRRGERVQRVGYEELLTLKISSRANDTVRIGDLQLSMRNAGRGISFSIATLLIDIKEIVRHGLRVTVAEPDEPVPAGDPPGALFGAAAPALEHHRTRRPTIRDRSPSQPRRRP